MGTGALGIPGRTEIATLAVAPVKSAVFVGVKVAESVCAAPTGSTVNAAGLYTNVPGVLAVAFSCVPLSAVP